MDPKEEQKNDSEEQPQPTTIRVSSETLRIVAMAAAGTSALMLVGSVIAYFVFGAFQTALVLAGIALIDPVIMQFVLSQLQAGSSRPAEVDLDSPFERYFYEKEMKQAQGGPLSQMVGPVLGGGVLLMVVGMVMDNAALSAKVLPLFALWAGGAFVLAMYAGSMVENSDSN